MSGFELSLQKVATPNACPTDVEPTQTTLPTLLGRRESSDLPANRGSDPGGKVMLPGQACPQRSDSGTQSSASLAVVEVNVNAANHNLSSAERHRTRRGPTKYMILLTACATFHSMSFGYIVGVTMAQQTRKPSPLGHFGESIFFASLPISEAVGGLVGHHFCDTLGRKSSFIACQMLLLLSVIVLSASMSFGMMTLGRLLLGIAWGAGFALAPLYIVESAPSRHRGKLAVLAQAGFDAGLAIGLVVSYALLNALPEVWTWHVAFGLGIVFPIVARSLVGLFLPESPRWSVVRGEYESAKIVLRLALGENESEPQASPIVNDIIQGSDGTKLNQGWWPCLPPSRASWRAIVLAIGVAISPQATGFEVIDDSSPYLTSLIGLHMTSRTDADMNILVSSLMACVRLAGSLLAACLVDAARRQVLLAVGTSLQGIALLLLALAITHLTDANQSLSVWSYLAAIAPTCYFFAFSFGVGPLAFILVPELFPTRMRARAVSLGVCSNRLMATLVILVAHSVGPASFLACISLAAAIAFAMSASILCLMPVKRNRSLEE